MKKKIWNRIMVFMLMVMVIVSAVPANEVSAASKMKLNKKTVKMTVGKKITLKVRHLPKNAKLTWSSSDKAIASVSKKGIVRAKKPGKATIRVKVSYRQNKKKRAKKLSCRVKVSSADSSASNPVDKKADSLVVYYSWSGNTKRIAERIAKYTGADLYEIKTKKIYPKDGHETAVISQEERRTGNLPELAGSLPDISGYDTIYIGGPVWNSYMPTPLEKYLEMTDFTEKTVIPFSTSQGSGQRGFQNDFKKRVKNPKRIGSYQDFEYPDNYSPNAVANEEIDKTLRKWLGTPAK